MQKLLDLFSREKLSKIEYITTLLIYYGLPIAITITLITAMISSKNPGYSRQERRGNNGRLLLTILLFIKPIILITKKYLNAQIITIPELITNISIKTIKKNLISLLINCIYSTSVYLIKFRRQLGIAAFWLITTHFLLWEIFRTRQGLPAFFNIGQTVIFTGIIGVIALFGGAITSNMFAVKILKNNRKKIQMLAYVAFFFGAIHTGNIIILIIYIILKYFELKEIGIITKRKSTIITTYNKLRTNNKSA